MDSRKVIRIEDRNPDFLQAVLDRSHANVMSNKADKKTKDKFYKMGQRDCLEWLKTASPEELKYSATRMDDFLYYFIEHKLTDDKILGVYFTYILKTYESEGMGFFFHSAGPMPNVVLGQWLMGWFWQLGQTENKGRKI
jgi:hypothetical protein